MRRQVQLRRRTPLRRAPLRAKRRKADIPQAVRDVVLARNGGQCEFRWDIDGQQARCFLSARHLHHRLPRSAGGKHTADNLLALCRPHHEYIHAHPAESYAAGWLLRRGTR